MDDDAREAITLLSRAVHALVAAGKAGLDDTEAAKLRLDAGAFARQALHAADPDAAFEDEDAPGSPPPG